MPVTIIIDLLHQGFIACLMVYLWLQGGSSRIQCSLYLGRCSFGNITCIQNTRTGWKSRCFLLNMFECWENINIFLITLTDVSWLAGCWSVIPMGLLWDRMWPSPGTVQFRDHWRKSNKVLFTFLSLPVCSASDCWSLLSSPFFPRIFFFLNLWISINNTFKMLCSRKKIHHVVVCF